jgi:hypothetical protein
LTMNKKNRRGRPPAFHDEDIKRYIKGRPWVNRRTAVNHFYGFKALGALKGMEGIEYLVIHNPAKPELNHARQSILTELGRLQDPEEMRKIARLICDQEAAGDNRTTKEWAAVIRKARIRAEAKIKETVSENLDC